ncbi:bifunctional diguanylate cyclase/phosphodiesterase [Caulobacter segnis]|uniref:Bifunctional diguanylate cyclase/phosphodiesterase n=1 Tax=Caulobacter segnis TaxID=88688 RepID=A0A2W5VF46_9CAUL|nr:EAL domain-containing protein [Caulobacter segnis]PZR33955.1 MAG: bifunctional diguanylate cyclase/phosphodiesterase [Caulobacter segnis]
MTALSRKLSAPLAMIALASVGLLLSVMIILAGQIDQEAQQHDRDLVERGLVATIRDVEHAVAPQVIWDEAVDHLDQPFDVAWARDNITNYLAQQTGFDQVFVLDGQDRMRLAEAKEGRLTQAEAERRVAKLAPLVAKLRVSEHGLKPRDGRERRRALIAAPAQVSAFAKIEDEIYLVTASLVRSETQTAPVRRTPEAIVITAMKMEGAFVDAFADRFLLAGTHLHRALDTLDDETGYTHLPLLDANGAVVATLDWNPPHPGQRLLRKTIGPVMAVVCALALATILLARRGRMIAEGLIASEARSKHLALHDGLTGLANRLLFEERLRQAIEGLERKARPMAVLAIDLDRFKAVNDTHGHAAGDELIRKVGERLASVCRGGETVARLGGDEFGVVAADIDPNGAAILAERLLNALCGPMEMSFGVHFVSGSVGVVLVSPDQAHIGAAEAARRADVALYRAKSEGRGRYCFFEDAMDAALKARRALEEDLRAALRDGAVRLDYQPQVDAGDRVIGVEALARWSHPTRGEIPPDAFIPLAEDCGLSQEMGRYVLRRALRDSLRWRGLQVGINVSARQMKRAGFIDELAELIRETGANPRQLALEITESALLGDGEGAHDTVDSLRQMGFSLVLDDFGVGCASLSYIRRYPIDRIKIDRSFVAPLGQDADSEAVVAAIVRLAKALSLSVMAKGVETAAQREILKAIGCAQAQGFLFSPPVAAETIDALLAQGGRLHPPAQPDAA